MRMLAGNSGWWVKNRLMLVTALGLLGWSFVVQL